MVMPADELDTCALSRLAGTLVVFVLIVVVFIVISLIIAFIVSSLHRNTFSR
jgi:hypothetical protein